MIEKSDQSETILAMIGDFVPDLPLELVEEILVVSANSGLKQAAILARVSHHVYDLIKPILFSTLVYWDDKKIWPSHLNQEWFRSNGKYARSILWGLDGGNMDIVFEFCPNLVNIAIWLDTNENDFSVLFDPLSRLPLRRLSTDLHSLVSGPFEEAHAQLPMFANLTHLEMAGGCVSWDHMKGIQYLPSLTHISLPANLDPNMISIIRGALTHCKHLAVLVLFDISSSENTPPEDLAVELPWPQSIQDIGDPRIVHLKCIYVEEWLVDAEGGRSTWTVAEEVVERRAGKL